MGKRSIWTALSAVLVALASFGAAGCGSDSKTGSTGNALTDCDAGDGGACTSPASTSTGKTGGW
jgi:hypothetical protein